MEIEKHEILCPCCEGKGKMTMLNYHEMFVKERKETAKSLNKRGFSYREIAKIFGLKSVRSVQLLLGKK